MSRFFLLRFVNLFNHVKVLRLQTTAFVSVRETNIRNGFFHGV
jgi:hypothetical protein